MVDLDKVSQIRPLDFGADLRVFPYQTRSKEPHSDALNFAGFQSLTRICTTDRGVVDCGKYLRLLKNIIYVLKSHTYKN